MFSSIMPLPIIGSAHQAPAWIILAIIFIIIIKIIIFVVFIVSMFSCTTFLFALNIRIKVWTRKNSTEENFLAISPFLKGEECSKENFLVVSSFDIKNGCRLIPPPVSTTFFTLSLSEGFFENFHFL